MVQKAKTEDLIDRIRQSDQELEFRIYQKHSAIPQVPILQRWKQVQVCDSREEVAKYFEQNFGQGVYIINEVTTRRGSVYTLSWNNSFEEHTYPTAPYNYIHVKVNPPIV